MHRKLTICLGSSCFARGNSAHLGIIERWIADNAQGADMVDVRGSCCEQMCSEGPNIRIDDRILHAVDAGMLRAVLDDMHSCAGTPAAPAAQAQDAADE